MNNDIRRYQDLVQQSASTARTNVTKLAQEKLGEQLKSMGIDSETIPIGAHLIGEGLSGGAATQIRRKAMQKVEDYAPDALKSAYNKGNETLSSLKSRAGGLWNRITSGVERVGANRLANPLAAGQQLNIQGGGGLHLEPVVNVDEAIAGRAVAQEDAVRSGGAVASKAQAKAAVQEPAKAAAEKVESAGVEEPDAATAAYYRNEGSRTSEGMNDYYRNAGKGTEKGRLLAIKEGRAPPAGAAQNSEANQTWGKKGGPNANMEDYYRAQPEAAAARAQPEPAAGLHAEPVMDVADDAGGAAAGAEEGAAAGAAAGAEEAAPLLTGEIAADTGLLAVDAVDQEIPLLDVVTDVATAGAGLATIITGAVEGAKAAGAPVDALKNTVESYSQQFGR